MRSFALNFLRVNQLPASVKTNTDFVSVATLWQGDSFGDFILHSHSVKFHLFVLIV